MARDKQKSPWPVRVLGVMLAGALLLVLLPRWLQPEPVAVAPTIHGAVLGGGAIRYEQAQLADILADIDARTGFHAVAFAVIGARRFTGTLRIGADGKAAVADLAASMGLELRQAGPHWVVTAPQGR